MHTDFTSVDAELQEIEADFASGRMNAFGDLSTQEAFLRELRRIAEIETQVFYKSCTLLKSNSESEYAMLTSMFASAQPPPGSSTANTNANARATPNSSTNFGGPLNTSIAGAGGGAGRGNASASNGTSPPPAPYSSGGGGGTPGRPAPLIPPSQQQQPASSMSFGRLGNTSTSRPSSPMSRSFQRSFADPNGNGNSFFGDTVNANNNNNNNNNNFNMNFSMANSMNFNSNTSMNFASASSFANSGNLNKSGGSGKPTNTTTTTNTIDWANKNGFDDHSFEEISAHYRRLEADFAAVGDNLRQISKHVVQLNTMSEQVNTAALDNGMDDEAPQKTASDFLDGSPTTH